MMLLYFIHTTCRQPTFGEHLVPIRHELQLFGFGEFMVLLIWWHYEMTLHFYKMHQRLEIVLLIESFRSREESIDSPLPL